MQFYRGFIAAILVSAALLICENAHAVSIDSITIASPAPTSGIVQVPLYTKIEYLVNLSTTSTKPYETFTASGGVNLSATFTSPTNVTWTINGFYTGSSWLIRFAPTELGAWSMKVTLADSTGSIGPTSGPGFTSVASAYPGFARISGSYLKFTNNTTLFAVGHNNGWQYDVEQPTLPSMAAAGENLLSFWLASPWALPTDAPPQNRRTPIENSVGGIGNYDQTACAYIEQVVNDAESANVYLLPSIWAHDQLCDGTVPAGWGANWSNNAYSQIAGCTATNFFQTKSSGVDTLQWHYQQNYYRYLLARWGYSRAIVGWVGIVEADGTTGYVNNSGQVTTWSTAVRTLFLGQDKYRYNGSSYPLVISKSDQPFNALDLRAVDAYHVLSPFSNLTNTNVASNIASDLSTMRSSGKPSLITEFGGDVTNGAVQPLYMNNGIWSGTANGAAAVPLLWCDGGSYPLLTDSSVGLAMRNHLQYLSQFVSGLDSLANGSATITTSSVNDANCTAWTTRLPDRGFVWIYNSAGTINAKQITLSGLTSGKYNVTWFDPWTSGSVPVSTQVYTAATGSMVITSPSTGNSDIAVKFLLNSAPTVATAASANPSSVTGVSTVLSVLGADDAGESNLSYTWSVTGPTGVSYSANGSNAAKTTTATFTQPGNYNFTATITDAAGSTIASGVTVTVIQTAAALVITPDSVSVPQSGSQQFTATVADQFGTVFSPAIIWSVDSGGTIDANSGLFSAGVTPGGPFTVKAVTGTISNTAIVVVTNATPAISAVTATPATVSGTTTALNVTASDPGGAALTYTWSVISGPSTVAFSDNATTTAGSSTATFSAAGNYVIGISVKNTTGFIATSATPVTVVQTPAQVTVSPPSAILVTTATQQFSAAITDQFGATIPNGSVALVWNDGGAGSIDGGGLLTAGTPGGPFNVSATVGAVAGSASVTVIPGNAPPVINSLVATPSIVTGTTTALVAVAQDDGGEPALTYTWARLSGPASVTFSANGTNSARNSIATFSAAGAYTFGLTVTDGAGFSASSTVGVTVQQTTATVTINPTSASLLFGQQLNFNASATDQFGAAITSFVWTATGGTVSGGLFTAGTTAGNAFSVNAAAGGASASANISIAAPNTSPVITSALCSPNPISGTSTALSAVAQDDGGEPALTYTWSGPAGVAFGSNGTNAAKNSTATFSAAGMFPITLTVRDAGGLTATSMFSATVLQTVSKVTISPTSVLLMPGQTANFSASAVDQFGAAMTTFVWSATGGTVGSNGSYKAGAAPGAYSVTASNNGATATASVTIAAGTLTGLAATPATPINLTTDGPTDWAHWGLKAATTFDHKKGVLSQIGNFTPVNATSGNVGRSQVAPSFKWTDGAPDVSSTGTKYCVSLSGAGKGFQFNVPAGTTVQTLNVYVAVTKAAGQFTATLSDGSAPSFSDAGTTNVTGTTYKMYTLKFAAVQPQSTLTVTWTLKSGAGSVFLEAASLGGGTVNGATKKTK